MKKERKRIMNRPEPGGGNEMTWFRLVLRGVFHPRGRAVMTLMALAVNAAGILIYWTFAAGIDLSLEREEAMLGADLLVLPAGVEFSPEEALVSGAPEGITMDDGLLEALAQVPEIKHFTPQLYFRSLSLGCCSMRDYPLIGIDPVSDFIVRPLAGAGAGDYLGEYGVVAGCMAARQAATGKVVFFNHPFVVKYRLPCTGMSADMTFFIPLDVSRKIAGGKLGIGPGDVSGVAVKLADSGQMDYVVELIEYLGDDVKVLKVPAMVRSVSVKIRLVEKILGISLAALGVGSLGFLVMACWMAAGVKRREAALLRALGASPAEVRRLAALEIWLLGVIGTAAGISAGLFVIRYLAAPALAGVSAPFVLPGTLEIAWIAAAAAAATMAVSYIAGTVTAVSLSNIEPDTALKNTR